MLRAFANGAVFGESYGTGRPWVLGLHGWARAHSDLAGAIAGRGAPAIDAILVDLPGFGASPAPSSGWSTAEYAAALSSLLGELAPRVVVLGHSFGGRVALHLARREPERIAGLVLTGVPLRPSDAPPRRGARRFRVLRGLRRAGLVSAARLESARNRYGSDDYRRASGVMREVLVRCVNESYDALLDEIAAPIELVWGGRDQTAPVALAERALERARAAHLHIVADADHFLPLQAPDALRRALLALEPR